MEAVLKNHKTLHVGISPERCLRLVCSWQFCRRGVEGSKVSQCTAAVVLLVLLYS